MNRLLFTTVICFIFIVAGCANSESVTEEQNIDKLVEQAEGFTEEDNYTKAIETYQEVVELSNNEEHKDRLEEIKEKRESLERDKKAVENSIDELKSVLFNPDGLQVNEVIIYYNQEIDWTTVYMDYSAMNKMGGYVRDYAYTVHKQGVLDTFYPSYESNYRSAEEVVDKEEETYYFDLTLIEQEDL